MGDGAGLMGAPDQKPKRPTPSPLIERGGLALVEFHLARRGIDCIRTQRDSSCGDIWANAPIGRISIEVKTTDKSTGWFVKRGQHGSSEIYCFVHLESARCWVLTAGEVGVLLMDAVDIHHHHVARIDAKALPEAALEAWEKIGAMKMTPVYRISKHNPGGNPIRKSPRTVRHKLADGTVKIYRYGPHFG